jgi:hypothetical protein
MVTDSEKKGLDYIKKRYKDAYIKKLPDFKQTNMLQGGLPDYLVINNDICYFIEIKLMRGKYITEKDFTSQQLVEFCKIYKNTNYLYVLVVSYKKIYLVRWHDMYLKFINGVNKITFKHLEEWNIE